MVNYIDPCLPAEELHTDNRSLASSRYSFWREQMRHKGGEWAVVWWEHPKDRQPKRECFRRGEPGELGFLHAADFPRSKELHRFDYMGEDT